MENLSNEVKNLLADEDFVKQISNIDGVEALKNLFIKNNVDITDEELQIIIEAPAKAEASEELSVEDMDNVAGGVVGWAKTALTATWGFACRVYGSPEAAVSGIYSYWRNVFRR